MASKLSLPRATLEPGKLPFVSLVSGIRAGPAPESGASGGNRERVPGVRAEGPGPPPFVRRCCRPQALPPRHGLGRLGRPVAAAPAPRSHRSPLQRPGAQVQATTQHRYQRRAGGGGPAGAARQGSGRCLVMLGHPGRQGSRVCITDSPGELGLVSRGSKGLVFPILNPPPSSLPIPSLWVLPVHQPQASSIVHRTWTGNSFHT